MYFRMLGLTCIIGNVYLLKQTTINVEEKNQDESVKTFFGKYEKDLS